MAEKLKTKGGGIKGFVGRHKAASGCLLVLVVVVVAIVIMVRRATTAVSAAMNYQFVRTTTLSKTSLEDSVTVNGTVKSGEVASVTGSDGTKTYKVATVNVAVGDTVKTGDVIATLDTTLIEQSIASAQQDYEDALQAAQTSYNRAAEDYNVELVRHQNDLIDAQEEIAKAQENLDEITQNYANLSGDYTADAANYERIEYYYNLYKDRIAAQDNTVSNLQTRLLEMQNSGSAEDIANAQQDYDAALNERTILNNQCSAPELGLFSFDEIAAKYQGIDTLTESVERAQDSYDDTKNYPSGLKSAYTTLLDATTKLAQAKRVPSNLTTLQNTLTECTLTATMDGTITALNAVVGSACSGTVATIQDTDNLTVEVTIPASSVPKLKVGMDCIITSDATGEREISGTLTRIDPVANDQGTFGATVTVYGDATNLLIGIQAKVEIIISSKDNVFVVPYDAIGTAEDGSSYILRSTGGSGVDMTFEQVEVTVGDSNDYYVEVSGQDLAQGDIIRSSSDLSEGIESADSGLAGNLDAMTEPGMVVSVGGAAEMDGAAPPDRGGAPGAGPGGA